MKRTAGIALCILVLAAASLAFAQTPRNPGLDLAVTYAAERSLEANTNQNFWMQGGSAEIGANLWHGLGPAANLTGTHTSSIASGGVPLSVIAVTFGPRYRFHPGHRLSPYGEVLLGVARGFDSRFPLSASVSAPSATSFAIQVGGGMDCRIRNRFSVRLLEAAWIRAQLPNTTDNQQNTLRLGSGLVYQFH